MSVQDSAKTPESEGKHDSVVELERKMFQRVNPTEWDEDFKHEDEAKPKGGMSLHGGLRAAVGLVAVLLIFATGGLICTAIMNQKGAIPADEYKEVSASEDVVRRQVYTYGHHPSVNWTHAPTATVGVNSTVTSSDLFTTSVTVSATVPASVSIFNVSKLATVSESATVIFNATATETAAGVNATFTTAPLYGNDSTTMVTESFNGVVTVTVVPVPVWTTESAGAVEGSASSTVSTVSNSTGPTGVGVNVTAFHTYWNSSTFARSTVYQTVTTTTFPGDNCTLETPMIASTSTTAGSDAMTGSLSESTFTTITRDVSVSPSTTSSTKWWSSTVITPSDEYTATVTETATPVVTVDATTTVDADTTLSGTTTVTAIESQTRTVFLTDVSTATLLGASSTAETCGAKDTETVTTTVVSTVYAPSPSSTVESTTSTSSMKSSGHLSTETQFLTTAISTQTISISFNSTYTYTDQPTETSTSKTPCSTETVVVTPTPHSSESSTSHSTTSVETTGNADGATGSLSSTHSSTHSSTTTHCNSTKVYTVTVTPTPSSTSMSHTHTADIFVSTIVNTIITTFTHDMDMSTSTSMMTLATSTQTHSFGNISLTHTLPNPLGPAAPSGVAPLGWNSSSGTVTTPSPSATTSSFVTSGAGASSRLLWSRYADNSNNDGDHGSWEWYGGSYLVVAGTIIALFNALFV